jgi:hypothetical protein
VATRRSTPSSSHSSASLTPSPARRQVPHVMAARLSCGLPHVPTTPTASIYYAVHTATCRARRVRAEARRHPGPRRRGKVQGRANRSSAAAAQGGPPTRFPRWPTGKEYVRFGLGEAVLISTILHVYIVVARVHSPKKSGYGPNRSL